MKIERLFLFLHLMQKYLFIFIGVAFLLEIYVYQSFKTITQNPIAKSLYWGITILVYIVFIYFLLNFDSSKRDQQKFQWIASIVTIFILPKLIIIAFLLIDEIFRFGEWMMHFFTAKNDSSYPNRRKFLSLLGWGITGLMSILVTDGILFGKYRHRARKVKLKLPNLPASFKGYKIVQISDVHSGSFLYPEKLQNAIRLINEQNADLVLFTGDMVNNFAEEFEPFVSLFAQIKAKDGKFSVLGNHDYGHYAQWDSPEEQAQNIPKLIDFQEKAGFTMLRNEHRMIEKNNEKLYLLGVENWGIKPFPQYGDLDIASAGIPKEATKILMSHDPSHFDEIVKHHPSDIHLTLSGHTHGMQFGIDLKNIKWSPVKYKYPKWADLYESNGKYLYVNRGFGVIGFPGRVGINPEITVFELS